MNSPDLVQEHTSNGGFISAFNSAFPMIISQFNTAMGDQSLGIAQNVTSNQSPEFGNKTATEVNDLQKQQNTRDQYNQSYLAEFLKDIMMMWLSNNKQFLFDDPTKKAHILRIIGKDKIQQLQQMNLDGTDIPQYAMDQIAQTIIQNPGMVSQDDLQGIASDVSVPTNPVVMNPNDEPAEYDVKKKLTISPNGQEALLYITPEDFDGEYDYIPDVKSMSAGAGQVMKDARQNALTLAINPQVTQQLITQGDQIKMKELLIGAFEDAGYKDAESLFQPVSNGINTAGTGNAQPGAGAIGANIPAGMGAPQGIPAQSSAGGLPNPNGLQGQAPAAGSPIAGLHL